MATGMLLGGPHYSCLCNVSVWLVTSSCAIVASEVQFYDAFVLCVCTVVALVLSGKYIGVEWLFPESFCCMPLKLLSQMGPFSEMDRVAQENCKISISQAEACVWICSRAWGICASALSHGCDVTVRTLVVWGILVAKMWYRWLMFGMNC